MNWRVSRSVAAFGLALSMTTLANGAAGVVERLINLVPADTVALAVVRWHEVRSWSFYRELEQRYVFAGDSLGFEEVIGLTGIDPARDIDAALFAIGTSPSGEEDRVIGLLNGRIDSERVLSFLGASAVVELESEKHGTTIYTVLRKDKPGSPSRLAFPGPGLLVFGDRSSVEETIEVSQDPGRGLAEGAALRQALTGARRSGQVWGAVNLERAAPRLGLRENGDRSLLAALGRMRWIAFDADFQEDLAVVLKGACKNTEEAELVRKAAGGLLALGMLGAGNDRELRELLYETKVTQEADRVVVRATIGRDRLERALSEQRRSSSSTRSR